MVQKTLDAGSLPSVKGWTIDDALRSTVDVALLAIQPLPLLAAFGLALLIRSKLHAVGIIVDLVVAGDHRRRCSARQPVRDAALAAPRRERAAGRAGLRRGPAVAPLAGRHRAHDGALTARRRGRPQRAPVSALSATRWRPPSSKLSGARQRLEGGARWLWQVAVEQREPGGVAVAALDDHVLAEGALIAEAEAPRRAASSPGFSAWHFHSRRR